jgi:signal transduction histidine kinase
MRRRLLVSTTSIALAAVLLLGIPLGVIGSQLLTQSVEQRLEREADTAAARIVAARRAGRPVDARLLSELAESGHRLEVRLPDGRVIAGGARLDGDVVRVGAGDARAPAQVTVVAPAHERSERVGGVWLAVVVLSVAAVGLAVVLGLLQGRRLAGPLEALARRTAALGSASPSRRPSSIAELAEVERALADAEERVASLLQREREFSANASHQIRSPLTGLRMRLEELEALAASDAAREEAQAAIVQVDRLLATIMELEAHARGHEARPVTTDLAAVARDHAEHGWRERFAGADRELTVGADDATPVALGAGPARQVVDILLDNALTHGGGRTTLTVDPGDGTWARLAVEDAGAGIPPGHEARIFERRHSLGGGSGVGLALARDLVRAAGGELSLARSRPPRFEARLPTEGTETGRGGRTVP